MSTATTILDITLVADIPLTLLITLPDGCRPGRFEAAQSFAQSVGRLRELYGKNMNFQLLPFEYVDDEEGTALVAILAIES
jgi:hypothetical protein